MKTKTLELTGYEARQLFHGTEFALKNLRESKDFVVPRVITDDEYKTMEQRLLALQSKVLDFTLLFETD